MITALAWLPMVPLTMLSGRFTSGVREPFLYDYEVHTKLLFSLPLMILAEMAVYVRTRSVPAQLIERQIITDSVCFAFNKVISSAMRLRDSVSAEIALLFLAVLAGYYIWPDASGPGLDTWYVTVTHSALHRTLAGWWYAFVSVPLFQFVLLRWYYRIFIWCRFLFQVSRLDLNLVPLHPDRCCALGFLDTATAGFAPLLMANSSLAAGFIAAHIKRDGASFLDYKFELIGMVAFLLLIFLGPLCVFIPKLNHAKVTGLETYGCLESRYAFGFAGKGTHDAAAEDERFWGPAADIRSLAALANSLRAVGETKLLPINKATILMFVGVMALPFVLPVLTMSR